MWTIVICFGLHQIDTTQLDNTIQNFRDKATASDVSHLATSHQLSGMITVNVNTSANLVTLQNPILKGVLNTAADDLTKIRTSIVMSIKPKLVCGLYDTT